MKKRFIRGITVSQVCLLLNLASAHAASIDPEFIWANSGGGTAFDLGYDIALDSSNNVFISGFFEGVASFGATTINTSTTGTASRGAYLAKYDKDGNLQWINQGGGDVPGAGGDINFGLTTTTDPSGNSFLGGQYVSTMKFARVLPDNSTSLGTTTLPDGNNDAAGFIAKYTSGGDLDWAKEILGSFNVSVTGADTDASGNLYATGHFGHGNFFGGNAVFDGLTSLNSIGGTDIFVAKYDPTGNVLWAKRAGSNTTGIGGEVPNDIVTDDSGNSFVTGRFVGTADFGAFNLTSAGEFDIFVAKYDPDGNVLWAKSAGSSGNDRGRGVAFDALGNVYVSGLFSGSATFGGTTLNSAGGTDIFVAKYNSAGILQWVKQAGGTADDEGYDITTDPQGGVYLNSYFTGTATIEGNTLNSHGGRDILTAKFDTDGNLVWTEQVGGSFDDIGRGIEIGNNGIGYITGEFAGNVSFDSINLLNASDTDAFVASFSQSSSTPVPEPSTGLLLISGLIGLAAYGRRRQVV